MTRRIVLPLLLVLTLFFSLLSLAEDAKPATTNPDLAAADQLYKESKFAEAADKYQAIINAEPNLVGAQYGLIRALLRQQKVDEASAAANRFLTAQPNSSVLLAGMSAGLTGPAGFLGAAALADGSGGRRPTIRFWSS